MNQAKGEQSLILLYEEQKFRALDLSDRLKKIVDEFFESEVVIVTDLHKQQSQLDHLSEKVGLIVINWNLNASHGSAFLQYLRSQKNFFMSKILLYGFDFSEEDQILIQELYPPYPLVTNWEKDESWREAIEKELNREFDDYDIWLKEIESAIQSRDVNAFLEYMENAAFVARSKENIKTAYLYGELLLHQKQVTAAVEFLTTTLQAALEKDAQAWGLKLLNTLGKAYCYQGNFTEASLIFEKLAQKSPGNLGHKIYFAQSLLGMDKVEEAKELYDDVAEQAPLNEAYQGQVMVATVQGDVEKAKSIFQKVNQAFEDPVLSSFFNNRGVSLVREKRIQEALSFYQNALFFVNRDKGKVLLNLGLAHHKNEDPEKAAYYLEESLRYNVDGGFLNKAIFQKYKEQITSEEGGEEESFDLLIIEDKEDTK